jgi:replicative DNA helicase
MRGAVNISRWGRQQPAAPVNGAANGTADGDPPFPEVDWSAYTATTTTDGAAVADLPPWADDAAAMGAWAPADAWPSPVPGESPPWASVPDDEPDAPDSGLADPGDMADMTGMSADDGAGELVHAAPEPPQAPAPARAQAPRFAPDVAWTFDTGIAVVQPRSATEVLSTLAGKVATGAVEQYQPVPLGFSPLDKTIGGGLRAGELLLIGGAQGTGKTTMAVQMARNIVLGGQASVLYICFEHDEEYLLNRIIAMESALSQLPARTGGVKLQDVRKEILGTWLAQGSESADLSANPRLRPALERINRYGANLFLLRGSQTTTTIENMNALIEKYKEIAGERRLVVFIDYMQKVPVIPDPPTETEKVTIVVNGLKDVALANHVPMISIVAADKEGLKAARLRNHHLRGSSAINYEADIILILNEKYQIVAKVNIEFNPYQAQRFRDWVICTVEKNRGGQNAVDLEFQKHFEYSCFDGNGRTVQEKLIEERLYND